MSDKWVKTINILNILAAMTSLTFWGRVRRGIVTAGIIVTTFVAEESRILQGVCE